jgi:hypothetical protein
MTGVIASPKFAEPLSDAQFVIQAEHQNGYPTFWCPSEAHSLRLNVKMIIPFLLTGVIESDRLTRHWVNAGYITALVQITFGTCQAKVVICIGSAMFDGNHVIDLKQEQPSCLSYPAIFTAVTCQKAYLTALFTADAHPVWLFSFSFIFVLSNENI